MSDAKSRPGLPSLWTRIGGPLITLVLAVLIELLVSTPLHITNPPAFLMLAIVFSAFSGGLQPGLLSALISWLYIAYFFSQPGQPFRYTDENLRRVIAWIFTMPLAALMVGFLNRRAARARIQHKDGTWRWIAAVGANMLAEPSVDAVVVNFRDITARVRTRRQLTAEHAIRLVLAEASNLTEAAPLILQAICEGLDWERAEQWSAIWDVDRQANVLHCVAVWQKPPDAFPEFDAATRRIEFAPGIGLPGRVWATGAAAWVPDVAQAPDFPRAAIAAKEGLHAAFAFPLRGGGKWWGC